MSVMFALCTFCVLLTMVTYQTLYSLINIITNDVFELPVSIVGTGGNFFSHAQSRKKVVCEHFFPVNSEQEGRIHSRITVWVKNRGC